MYPQELEMGNDKCDEYGCHWWQHINDKVWQSLTKTMKDKAWHGKGQRQEHGNGKIFGILGFGAIGTPSGPNDPVCGHLGMMGLIGIWRTLTLYMMTPLLVVSWTMKNLWSCLGDLGLRTHTHDGMLAFDCMVTPLHLVALAWMNVAFVIFEGVLTSLILMMETLCHLEPFKCLKLLQPEQIWWWHGKHILNQLNDDMVKWTSIKIGV